MMADDLSDLYTTDGTGSSAAPPHPGTVGGGLDELYTHQPEMTPAPPPQPKLMDTSFKQLPGGERGDGSWWNSPDRPWADYGSPGTSDYSLSGAASRVADAATDAYRNSSIIGPAVRNAISGSDWLSRAGRFGVDLVNTAGADVSALSAGTLAALSEALGGGDPKLTRDVSAAAHTVPIVASAMPPAAMLRAPPDTYGPSPPPRIPINVPDDASPIVSSLYKTADASGATLNQSVTDGFLSDLDKYHPQSAAGQATAGPDATSALIARLQNLRKAPLDTVQSVQDIDAQIQKAIAGEVRPDGSITPQGREMKQIQQDFRARTFNPQQTDVAGDPAGFQALSQATQAYAAQARMKAVQDILDQTENSPNRANAIASRVDSLTKNPKNVAGWTDEEIASVKQASSSGALRDWLRTEGSRMAGMLGTLTGGHFGPVVGPAVNFGLSYGLRNALENLRVRDLERTMQLQGQRVPQPGTAPPAPALSGPPALLGTALRYQPTTSLLGDQQQNSQ